MPVPRFRSRCARLALVALLATLAACGSSGTSSGPGGGAIALSLSPTSATVPQGGSTQITGTLTRSGGFTGDITIVFLNPPAGITGTLTTPPINGSSTAVATLAVASSVATGSYPLQVQASGTGVTPDTAQFTLTVVAAPGFTLTGTPAALSLPQATAATTGVKAVRTGGLTGTISYAASGAQAGLTVGIAPTSVADSSSITATAAASVATGVYPIVITGTSGSLSQQTTITVTVTATITLDFTACAGTTRPLWVASQDGSGAWTQLTAADNVYHVPVFASGKGALAAVTQTNLGTVPFYLTTVQYFTEAELAATVSCPAPVTGKTIHGSVAGLTGTNIAEIALGGGSTAITTPATPNFVLTNVPDGLQDLTAFLRSGQGAGENDRIILRRDQNIADGGSLAVLDFGGPEAFTPDEATLTVTGGTTNAYFPTGKYLVGPNCVADTIDFSNISVASPFTIYGVPAAQQRTTDFHEIVLAQLLASDARTVSTSFHTLTDKTVAIGAGIGPVNTSMLPGTYRRLEATFTLAPDYTSASLFYSSSGVTAVGEFSITQSAAFLGGATAITLAAPDFTTVAGFQTVWGPNTTGSLGYTVGASSTPPATMCAEGATIRTASKSVGGM